MINAAKLQNQSFFPFGKGMCNQGLKSSEGCGIASLSIYWGSVFPAAQLFGMF